MQANRFADKVALVTGAASGIGRSTALRLAREGAAVMLADINEAGLKETLATINEQKGKAATIRLDVADEKACRDAVEITVKQFGRLDVLCNIAGFVSADNFTDIAAERWHKMVAVNLSSVFFLSQAAMPHLLSSKGNIVNMASSAGLVGQAYNSMYCATKGGVVMLSKALATEYTGRGVRVNAVCPGGVNTPLTATFKVPEGADAKLIERLMPLTDVAEPEEIAAAVAYLASDEARFVSGIAFSIDGGQVAC